MRKSKAKKRPLLPDSRFNDQLVTRFVNNLMWNGKKSTAFKIFYDAIDIIDEKKQNDEKTALQIWKDGLSNVMPHVEVRSCLLYTSPSPRDRQKSRMPSSA